MHRSATGRHPIPFLPSQAPAATLLPATSDLQRSLWRPAPWRMAIRPDLNLLCTDAAKNPKILDWSWRRSRH
jgi:hypothetical protein